MVVRLDVDGDGALFGADRLAGRKLHFVLADAPLRAILGAARTFICGPGGRT